MPFQNGLFCICPTRVNSTDYLAMQIDGPPPSAFTTAGFNQGEPAPSSQGAQGDSGPTAAQSLQQPATPVLLGSKTA